MNPDLVVFGVGVMTPGRNGGCSLVTGTSFAMPFVTGTEAFLIQ